MRSVSGKGFDRHKPTRTGQHRAGTPISGKEAVYQTVTGQRQTSAETLAPWGRYYQPIDLMYSVLHRLWDFRDYGDSNRMHAFGIRNSVWKERLK